jgi:hypothetical protein
MMKIAWLVTDLSGNTTELHSCFPYYQEYDTDYKITKIVYSEVEEND